MKIEKVATGNGEEVGGKKQTIKRTNSIKKKMANKISQSTWKKKALKIKLLGKKRQTVMQNGSDTSVY